MLPVLLASFLFVLLMTIISVYGYRAYVRPSRIYDRVGGMADAGAGVEAVSARPRDMVVRIFEQIGEQIPLSGADLTISRRDLMMAGFRSDAAIRIFMGMKVIFAIVLVMFGISVNTHVTDNPVLRVVFIIACGGLGYYGPVFYLESLVKKRQQKLRMSLPPLMWQPRQTKPACLPEQLLCSAFGVSPRWAMSRTALSR